MKSAQGSDVMEWPEFKVLCERLMVDLKPSTSCLTITVPRDGVVRIAQDTRGAGMDYDGRDRHLPENTRVPNIGMWKSPGMSSQEPQKGNPDEP